MMEPDSRGFAGGNLLLPAAGIAVLVAIVVIAAMMCGGGGDDSDSASNRTPTPEPTVATNEPDAALAAHVKATLNADYAGPCSGAQTGADAGKVCSTSRGEREGIRAFVLGKALSEGEQWAFLEQRGSEWVVTSTLKITPDNEAVPGVPWPLKVGAEVEIVGTGSCLNVRTEPGGSAVDCLVDGTKIRLAAGPRDANSLQWWQVEGRNGWVAADYLRFPDAKTDATPTPRPSATSSAAPAATPRQ